ncbi:MAG: hypothetical protein HC915_13130, partial [Anaerolineae bacterium]|nr:hypothetical protein [Anaerolineae bacterium]
ELNRAGQEITAGEVARIHWNAIPDPAYAYRVRLTHPNGQVVEEAVVQADAYAFAADQFVSVGFTYRWEIQPVLEEAPACPAIVGEIIVRN